MAVAELWLRAAGLWAVAALMWAASAAGAAPGAAEQGPVAAPLAGAAGAPWTLAGAVRRALEVAPAVQAADAEVAVREAELTRDGAWPNPTIEARANQKLGIEDGTGGTAVTQLALTQPLPFTRLARQRAQARANLAQARAARRYRRLVIEREAVAAFLRLQRAQAIKYFAGERVSAAHQYATRRRSGDKLVRFLSAYDRARLAILLEGARQAAMAADGEWREAAAVFRVQLALAPGAAPEVEPLREPDAPPPFAALKARLEANPALVAARRDVDAARAGVEVARASRFADPSVSVFRERDVLAGARRNYSGIAVGVQVPLWNTNSGPVDRARAEVLRAKAELIGRTRALETSLRERYLRLASLVRQSAHYRASVLEPSRTFLALTRRGFAAGEMGVLALLDANANYFDAAQRYLDLMVEASIAAADLRLAAGESVLVEVAP